MSAAAYNTSRFCISLVTRSHRLESAIFRTAGVALRPTPTVSVSVWSPGRLTSRVGPRASQLRPLHTSNFALNDAPAKSQKTATATIDVPETKANNGVKKSEVLLDELVQLIDREQIRLIDVREPREIEETGSIPTSINIPLTQLKGALSLSDEQFLLTFGVTKPRKDNPDVVYYGLSSVKSAAAVEIAHKLGFKRARHYSGGWDEWSIKCRSEGTY